MLDPSFKVLGSITYAFAGLSIAAASTTLSSTNAPVLLPVVLDRAICKAFAYDTTYCSLLWQTNTGVNTNPPEPGDVASELPFATATIYSPGCSELIFFSSDRLSGPLIGTQANGGILTMNTVNDKSNGVVKPTWTFNGAPYSGLTNCDCANGPGGDSIHTCSCSFSCSP